MFLTMRTLSSPRHGLPLLLAVACFAAGLTAGALIVPVAAGRGIEVAPPPPAPLRSGHPAELLRVIDGDTFEARVRIWPGMEITTKIRLRGIDAPEIHARCDGERVQAVAARDALVRILSEGAIGVARIGQDKYGGRVDADVSTARTADVAAAMAERGLVRRYASGRRESWCAG